ncbi:MAG: UDP-N-acetylmuramoyl-L-alanine--D-glutamate ligase [Leptospiraceae bacterium]|nr:UDP-N-acetylmuramoyl-L-alanine--D-glutamate ligase [Leptospiraceae bacterium]
MLDKKVLIIGAGGKTGNALVKLAVRRFKTVIIWDDKPGFTLPFEHENLQLAQKEHIESGSILEKIDFITLSPGVPLNKRIFRLARNADIPILSEIELCNKDLSRFKIIGITGTDGKSTVTSMLTHMLNHFADKPNCAIACGNFGLPFSQIVIELEDNPEKYSAIEYLVAELSSYQLELFRNVRLQIAMFLNLAPDHLDRYADMSEYGRAKWNILNGLRNNDLAIINSKLMPGQTDLFDSGTGHPLQFPLFHYEVIAVEAEHSRSKNVQLSADDFLLAKNETICHLNELKFRGKHNYINLLFVVEAFLRLFPNAEKDVIKNSISGFTGLPHRYEILANHKQITFINDSKATTCQALSTALQNSESQVYLFCGGKSKGEDYSLLRPVLEEKAPYIFLYGDNKEELRNAWQETGLIYSSSQTLDEAFAAALEKRQQEAQSDVLFLLSPASTSWDQYSSFEERGDHFRKLVNDFQNY